MCHLLHCYSTPEVQGMGLWKIACRR
jgi:hypothetical protein